MPYGIKERAAANLTNPVCRCSLLVLIMFRAVLIEQTVDFKCALCADENHSIGNGRHAEFYILYLFLQSVIYT